MLSHSIRVKRLPAALGIAFLSGLGLMTARPVLAQTQYSFTSFDVSGTGLTDTAIFGLNDSGEIAGSYMDAGGNTNAFYGTTASQNDVDLSKVLASQTPAFSEINKINNAGTYAGDFEMSSTSGYTTQQGFVGTNGTVIATSIPNSQALGINNLNTTVGEVQNSTGTGDQSYVQSSTGTVTKFNVLNFDTSEATAINDSGVIVGNAALTTTNGPTVSYIRSAGSNPTFSFIDIGGAYDVFAQDISNDGTVVGAYDTLAGDEYGFVFTGASLTTVTFPDALATEVEAINSQGELAGTYIDSMGVQHGFLAAPVPEASTTVSLGLLLGMGGLMLIAKRKKAQAAA
ncbi:MAG: hypothetical protein ACRYFS_05475 [Janthinobacterium lividum]